MLLIDSRTGSGELVPLFRPYNLDVESTTLDSADIAWAGNGPDGPVSVGVERKRLSDLIQSMRDNRLAGKQIPRMHDHYSRGHLYLIVEGVWRCGRDGRLEWLKHGKWLSFGAGQRIKPIMYREISSFLQSVRATMGVKVVRTGSAEETVAELVSMYNWYSKPWEDHHTAATIYAPEPECQPGTRIGYRAVEAGLIERIAAQLPGISFKAWEVGRSFKSPREMANAGVKEWEKIAGIGRKGAKTIVEAWCGSNKS